MTSETLFMDTSIPIYAAGRPSDQKDACARLLEKVESGALKVAIDTEVIQEIMCRFHRLDMDESGLDLCENVLRLGMRVLPVSRRDVEEALRLSRKYISNKIPPRDTLHAAVMLNNGIASVITLDKHFGDVVKEVSRVEPTSLLQDPI
jgi:uncharacterized protein